VKIMKKKSSAEKTPEIATRPGDISRRQFLAKIPVAGLGALALGSRVSAASPHAGPSREPAGSESRQNLDFLPDPGWC